MKCRFCKCCDKTDTSFGLPKNIKRGILSVLFQKLRVDEKIILVEKKMVGRFTAELTKSGKPKKGHFVGFVKKVAEVKKIIFRM